MRSPQSDSFIRPHGREARRGGSLGHAAHGALRRRAPPGIPHALARDAQRGIRSARRRRRLPGLRRPATPRWRPRSRAARHRRAASSPSRYSTSSRSSPHLDEIDETARRIGAVNTVVRRDGRLHGSNTDWLGAVRALERETTLDGKRAVVLGAGGTARAVVYGLLERGAKVHVLNRTAERARELCDALGAQGAGPLDELQHTPHDVLVNTTSIGLGEDASPVAAEAIAPAAVVLDAVYGRGGRDPVLRDARMRGARPVRGSGCSYTRPPLTELDGRQAPSRHGRGLRLRASEAHRLQAS